MSPILKIKIFSLKLGLFFILIIFGNPAHAEYYLVYSTPSAPCCYPHKTHKSTWHRTHVDYKGERIHRRTHQHRYHRPYRKHYHCPCRYYETIPRPYYSCACRRNSCDEYNTYYPKYKVYTRRYTCGNSCSDYDINDPYYDYADGATGDDDPLFYPDMQITNPPY